MALYPDGIVSTSWCSVLVPEPCITLISLHLGMCLFSPSTSGSFHMGHKLATPMNFSGWCSLLGKFQSVCCSLAVNTLLTVFYIENEYCFVNMLLCGNGVNSGQTALLTNLESQPLQSGFSASGSAEACTYRSGQSDPPLDSKWRSPD